MEIEKETACRARLTVSLLKLRIGIGCARHKVGDKEDCNQDNRAWQLRGDFASIARGTCCLPLK